MIELSHSQSADHRVYGSDLLDMSCALKLILFLIMRYKNKYIITVDNVATCLTRNKNQTIENKKYKHLIMFSVDLECITEQRIVRFR